MRLQHTFTVVGRPDGLYRNAESLLIGRAWNVGDESAAHTYEQHTRTYEVRISLDACQLFSKYGIAPKNAWNNSDIWLLNTTV